MSPTLRTALVALLFSILAVWVGISLAQEELLVAALLAVVSVWAIFAWTRGPLAESWLLGFLVFGYVIGNRGFAQITPIARVPLLLSELGLGAVLTLVLLRGALQRIVPLQRDWLNGLLILWLALGAGRIFWDVRAHGFMALRDFAMIYYVLYFFSAQALTRHEPSRRLLSNALLVTYTVLPVTGLLSAFFPSFFQNNLVVNGVPLIFYKGDLLATFLFTGFIIVLPPRQLGWGDAWWRWLAALAALGLGLTLLSRSSLVGLTVAIGWLGLSGRWRAARTLLAVGAAGLLLVTVHSLLQKQAFTETKAYAIYEAVVSIADYSGTRDYQNEMSSDKGDNNRFRLVWWKNVAAETLATSPLLGLGFGADLARGFLAEYYPTSETDFSARSPHNIFMTTLGRMGLLGMTVLAMIYWVQARITLRTARAARHDPAREEAMTLQAAVWVVLVSACLGVVLEGPMSAIPFWITLGLAHHAATTLETPPATAGTTSG